MKTKFPANRKSQKPNQNFYSRFVSFFVLITFIASNSIAVPTSYAADIVSSSQNQKSFPNDLAAVHIPEKLGKIQETFKGKSEKVVVLVQDAHAIPDAQRNIQKIIDHFQKEYGLNFIALEGAASELDPQIFKSFPDKEILKKIFDQYFERGELTGSMTSAIFNETPSIYHGIENWPLYEEGLSLYLNALENDPAISEQITFIKKNLQKRKESIYSRELLELDKALENFQDNHANLAEILQKLATLKAPEKGTELALLVAEAGRIKENQSSIEIEVKQIATQLKSSLKSSDLVDFNKKFQEFQTSRLTPETFALFLKDLAIKHKISIHMSDQLTQLINDQKQMRDIEGTKLFKDFEIYAQSVKNSLFKNSAQKKLDQESRRIELLGRLAKLELSREDWNEIKSEVAKSELKESLKFNIAFYENAQKREDIFIKNLASLMKDYQTKSSLLVAGGFHTEGLIQRLKQDGVSYLLVMPQIGSIPQETHYKDLMKGSVSWKDYFQVENGKVNLYKAFIRSCRDSLLKESKEKSSQALKNWRDQIIRDLVEKEQIPKINRYTSFIDEVSQKEHQPQWQIKVEKFIQDLRKLDVEKKLTEQNIVRLLQPSTMQIAASGPRAMEWDGTLSVVDMPDIVRSEVRAESIDFKTATQEQIVARLAAAGVKKGRQKQIAGLLMKEQKTIRNARAQKAMDLVKEIYEMHFWNDTERQALVEGNTPRSEVRASQKKNYSRLLSLEQLEDRLAPAVGSLEYLYTVSHVASSSNEPALVAPLSTILSDSQVRAISYSDALGQGIDLVKDSSYNAVAANPISAVWWGKNLMVTSVGNNFFNEPIPIKNVSEVIVRIKGDVPADYNMVLSGRNVETNVFSPLIRQSIYITGQNWQILRFPISSDWHAVNHQIEGFSLSGGSNPAIHLEISDVVFVTTALAPSPIHTAPATETNRQLINLPVPSQLSVFSSPNNAGSINRQGDLINIQFGVGSFTYSGSGTLSYDKPIDLSDQKELVIGLQGDVHAYENGKLKPLILALTDASGKTARIELPGITKDEQVWFIPTSLFSDIDLKNIKSVGFGASGYNITGSYVVVRINATTTNGIHAEPPTEANRKLINVTTPAQLSVFSSPNNVGSINRNGDLVNIQFGAPNFTYSGNGTLSYDRPLDLSNQKELVIGLQGDVHAYENGKLQPLIMAVTDINGKTARIELPGITKDEQVWFVPTSLLSGIDLKNIKSIGFGASGYNITGNYVIVRINAPSTISPIYTAPATETNQRLINVTAPSLKPIAPPSINPKIVDELFSTGFNPSEESISPALSALMAAGLAQEEKKSQIFRSELRNTATELVHVFKGDIVSSEFNLDHAAQIVIAAGVEPFVLELNDVASEIGIKEAVQKEHEINSYLDAIESAEPIYIDYLMTEKEMNQLPKLLETARNLNAKSQGKIMTRIVVPDGLKNKIKLPADSRKGDPIKIEILQGEVRVYNPNFSGSQKLGVVPATVIVTSSEVPGRLLLKDKLASGENLPSEENTASEILIATGLAVTLPPLEATLLLKTVGEVKGFVQQRIQNSGALEMLHAVAHRLAEQFRSELRIHQAA